MYREISKGISTYLSMAMQVGTDIENLKIKYSIKQQPAWIAIII